MTTMTKSSVKTKPVIKTALAPNAPWPKWEEIVANTKLKQVFDKKPKIKVSNLELDYFAEARRQIAERHKTRDHTTGRFTSAKRVAG